MEKFGMKIAIGSDHAGYGLKEKVIKHLVSGGYQVVDHGTNSEASADYPDYAHKVASDIEHGVCPLGIVICGSGNGVNITANKHQGVRSALCWATEIASLARAHNDANVLAMPARYIDEHTAFSIVDAFLSASFEGGRHATRVNKI